MLAIWLISIVIFVAILIYMYAQSKAIHVHTEFNEKFMKTHRRCEIYPYERYRYFFFFALAVVLLLVGLWFLFQGYFDPAIPYALVAISMSLLSLTQAMKDYYSHQIIFFNKGFVWEEQTFYYADLDVSDEQIKDGEAIMPLENATRKEIVKRYNQWVASGAR